MHFPLLLIFLFTTFFICMPSYAQDKTGEIDKIFSSITASSPGCVCAVSKDGEVVVNKAYGLADVDRRIPLNQHSAFDIGSVHKQFVAAAVILLAEDSRLSLSDNIRTYLPELPDYGHKITVDHLLTHTSGIRDWTNLLPMAEEGTEVLPLIMRQSGLNFTPGEEWSYSNSGYVLLKEIVERVSGMSFAEFTHTRLFEPLGMMSSAYVSDILQYSGERALAYQKDGTGWKMYMRLGNERAGGGVASTAADLLLWNEALTSGQLSKSVAEKLQEPAKLNNGRKLTYARGLQVNIIPGGPMIWHSGGAAGYGTWLGRFTDHGLSIAVMCNFEPVSTTDFVSRVADQFLPPLDPQAQPPGPVAVPGIDVTGRAGLYFEANTGEPLRLILNNGRLAIATGPSLVPVSAVRFRPQNASLFYRSEDEFEMTFRSKDEFDMKSMEGQLTRYRRAQPWTPTAADLQAVDGRYHSEDIGTVFEILPGTNGLIWRFEEAPEKAVELKPVAHDTYMQNMQIVRFHRDTSGKVTGFEYSNPAVRKMRYTRLGERKGDEKSVYATGDKLLAEPAVQAPRLEGLAGEYEMAPGRSITITLEAGQLHGQPTDNEKQPLVHVSGATFAVGRADGPVTVTFTIGTDGRATGMVMHQNGNERTLPKVR